MGSGTQVTGIEAVVVGRTDLGDADRVVRLLTADHGRIDLIARGARASRKRFAGALDPGTHLRVSWRQGRGELAALESADVLAAPRRAREDYARIVWLAYGCELLGALSERDVASPRTFGLLLAWTALLEGEARVTDAARVALEAKALTFAGLTPRLVTCAACGLALAGAARFDAEAGGGVHLACGGGRTVSADDLATVETLRRTPLSDTAGIPLPNDVRWLLTDFAEHHTRRSLRARALLEGDL